MTISHKLGKALLSTAQQKDSNASVLVRIEGFRGGLGPQHYADNRPTLPLTNVMLTAPSEIEGFVEAGQAAFNPQSSDGGIFPITLLDIDATCGNFSECLACLGTTNIFGNVASMAQTVILVRAEDVACIHPYSALVEMLQTYKAAGVLIGASQAGIPSTLEPRHVHFAVTIPSFSISKQTAERIISHIDAKHKTVVQLPAIKNGLAVSLRAQSEVEDIVAPIAAPPDSDEEYTTPTPLTIPPSLADAIAANVSQPDSNLPTIVKVEAGALVAVLLILLATSGSTYICIKRYKRRMQTLEDTIQRQSMLQNMEGQEDSQDSSMRTSAFEEVDAEGERVPA